METPRLSLESRGKYHGMVERDSDVVAFLSHGLLVPACLVLLRKSAVTDIPGHYAPDVSILVNLALTGVRSIQGRTLMLLVSILPVEWPIP